VVRNRAKQRRPAGLCRAEPQGHCRRRQGEGALARSTPSQEGTREPQPRHDRTDCARQAERRVQQCNRRSDPRAHAGHSSQVREGVAVVGPCADGPDVEGAHPMAIVQKQVGKHPDHVFTLKGQPIEQPSTAAWYKGLKRAASRTSDGTICVTRGPAGMSRAERHCTSFKSLEGGQATPCAAVRSFRGRHGAPWAERLASVRDDRGTNPSQPADARAT